MDHKHMNDTSQGILDQLNSSEDPMMLFQVCLVVKKQAVAIARTRLSMPKIVLMDEPTAAVSVAQVPVILEYIKTYRNRILLFY
ncbi:hypothetical protein CM15mP35_03480 [bacterium]|nr:MAG: hypothetical protein CM15mP35_03480 [bacterium]